MISFLCLWTVHYLSSFNCSTYPFLPNVTNSRIVPWMYTYEYYHVLRHMKDSTYTTVTTTVHRECVFHDDLSVGRVVPGRWGVEKDKWSEYPNDECDHRQHKKTGDHGGNIHVQPGNLVWVIRVRWLQWICHILWLDKDRLLLKATQHMHVHRIEDDLLMDIPKTTNWLEMR